MTNDSLTHKKTCSLCNVVVYARGLCRSHYRSNKKEFSESLYTGHMPLEERLNYLSELVTESGCRIWTSSVNKSGYGRLGVSNKVYLAHRLSYEVAYGEIPNGMHVLHKCDTPSCINPNHLFLGTDDDNMKDKVRKNRQLKGDSCPVSILTSDQVIRIRKDKRQQKDIAKDYGVHQGTISAIKTRTNWKHVN